MCLENHSTYIELRRAFNWSFNYQNIFIRIYQSTVSGWPINIWKALKWHRKKHFGSTRNDESPNEGYAGVTGVASLFCCTGFRPGGIRCVQRVASSFRFAPLLALTRVTIWQGRTDTVRIFSLQTVCIRLLLHTLCFVDRFPRLNFSEI